MMLRKNSTAYFQVDIGDGLGLYPLGKLVDRYEQVSEAARARF